MDLNNNITNFIICQFKDFRIFSILLTFYGRSSTINSVHRFLNKLATNIYLNIKLSCKGHCNRFESKKGGKYSLYAQNFKRCSECDIYIKYDGNRCPCCNYPLRNKRRSTTTNKLSLDLL
jgi:hypothetical protein